MIYIGVNFRIAYVFLNKHALKIIIASKIFIAVTPQLWQKDDKEDKDVSCGITKCILYAT